MFLTIIAFLAVLGILVLVHEWGHYITARRAGARVYEFGFGLPPRLIGFYKTPEGKWKIAGPRTKQADSMIWSLNWIPLGGFVKIKGEEGEAAQETDSLSGKSIGTRAIVFSSGVAMNLLLAVVLLSIGALIGIPQVLDDAQLPAQARISNQEVRIVSVLEDSPAAAAGLEAQDAIVSIDDQVVNSTEAVQSYVADHSSQALEVAVRRDAVTQVYTITPEVLEESGEPALGVGLVTIGVVSYPWYTAAWYGVVETLALVWGVLYGFFVIIRELLVGQELVGEVYGPVGIATLAGNAARLGILYLLQFTAVLSVIIAVINYLPFPALDGGRVLFLLIEKVRGKPVNERIENTFHTIGFILLMALIVLVTYQDIARLVTG